MYHDTVRIFEKKGTKNESNRSYNFVDHGGFDLGLFGGLGGGGLDAGSGLLGGVGSHQTGHFNLGSILKTFS
jgi:hypothetical protein